MRSCFAFPVSPNAAKRKGVQVGVGTRILNFSVVRGWMRRLGRQKTLKRHAITAGNHSLRSTGGSRSGASEATPRTLFLDQPSRIQRRPSHASISVQTVVV
ncbi:hypothetical protein R1flu_015144 [Riccia fluitans]|uniref:Uncharacterized protein n=1 Tax=Riccia fluitans TaxID=41844 RepID=A0ABD1YIG5_9MARC